MMSVPPPGLELFDISPHEMLVVSLLYSISQVYIMEYENVMVMFFSERCLAQERVTRRSEILFDTVHLYGPRILETILMRDKL